MAIIAGVDFGTLNVRVSIVDSGRGLLASAIGEYPLHRRRDEIAPPASASNRASSLPEAVSYVDVSGTFDKAAGQFSVFLFNRDLANAREAELLWEDAAPSRVLDSFTLTGNDLKAHNGFDAPQNVAPKPFDKPTTLNHRTRLELPARSYTIIQFAI